MLIYPSFLPAFDPLFEMFTTIITTLVSEHILYSKPIITSYHTTRRIQFRLSLRWNFAFHSQSLSLLFNTISLPFHLISFHFPFFSLPLITLHVRTNSFRLRFLEKMIMIHISVLFSFSSKIYMNIYIYFQFHE